MANNYLTSNKGTLTLALEFKSLNYTITDYTLPDLNLEAIVTPTRLGNRREAGNPLTFGSLQITFIVDEDLQNYLEIFNWMKSIGFPDQHEQYRGNSRRFFDGTAIINSSHNNPIMKIKFFDLVPTNLSGISFTESDTETSVRTASVSFELTTYDFVSLT